MKTYTVKNISAMCNVDCETVRRWIRDGKMNASIASKKEGCVITEANIVDFVTRYPKYKCAFDDSYDDERIRLMVELNKKTLERDRLTNELSVINDEILYLKERLKELLEEA